MGFPLALIVLQNGSTFLERSSRSWQGVNLMHAPRDWLGESGCSCSPEA
jgi:hypothetical protein